MSLNLHNTQNDLQIQCDPSGNNNNNNTAFPKLEKQF